jgi:immune inhibitor A
VAHYEIDRCAVCRNAATRLVILSLSILLVLLCLKPLPSRVEEIPQIMPPHPSLRERLLNGEGKLPRFAGEGVDSPNEGAPARPQGLTGVVRALAVLVDFSDKVRTTSASFFDTLLFELPRSGRGSVRDYFSEISYGRVDIVSVNLPGSLGWQRAPQPYSYYVGTNNCVSDAYPRNCRKLAEDVVDVVSSVVNFANYDNDGDGNAEPIMLIHAGSGAEFTLNGNDIWSHSWSLRTSRILNGVMVSKYVIMPEYWRSANATNSDMTIGVFAHEMAHGFWGQRDLYDRDGSSHGAGNWSLMAAGSWNGPGSNGSSPAWPDAWSRIQMGFAAPTRISANVDRQSIPQTYNNSSTATVFQLGSASLGAKEYYLVENRQRVPGSYDEYLPNAGLLVWHVDEAMDDRNLYNDYECVQSQCCNCSKSQHYLVALEQADGQKNLERKANMGDGGDPFPGTLNRRAFGAMSTPASSSWYACGETCIGMANISPSSVMMQADLRVVCGSLLPKVYMPGVNR